MSRPLFTKHDFLIIGGILIAAVLFRVVPVLFILHTDLTEGRISVDGTVVITTGLSSDAEIALPGYPGIMFAVRDGAIAFRRSNCSDKSCVNSGFLSRPGQAAACLPNRVSLVIAGQGGHGDIDAVAR
jgi:hypothetical protein